MKNSMFSRIIGICLINSMFFSCVSTAPASKTSNQTASNSIYYTGSGGSGMRLAVLVPSSSGLSDEQDYLPTLVQGVLVEDINKYSAITVLDRMSLEKVLTEIESGIYKDESDYVKLGEIANVDHILTGNISKTTTGYAMQIQIVGTTGRNNTGVTKASYNGSCTIAEFDDFTGIRKASLNLLPQMGVNLRDAAKQELTAASKTAQMNTETALARGITAQRQGTEVEALSYFFQAATYDSSSMEAITRSSILNANITSGNIGDDIRNDMRWRGDWMARLTETEQYFNDFNRKESMPYTLFYSDEIKRGAVNYQNDTVALSIETHLHGSRIK